jgi:Zn-dependent protease
MNSDTDQDQWSVCLGRWRRLTVRLHIVCPLFLLVTLYLCVQAEMLHLGLLSLAVLATSVLAHEWGHLFATRRLGGECECIVLWPFGGIASVTPWASPQKGLLAAFAGPAVNLLICLVCGFVLWSASGASCWRLLIPLYPVGLTGTVSVAGLCELVLWINWMLFVMNLVPAYPFDGGRLIYYSLAGLRPGLTRAQLRAVLGQTARAFAVGLLILAWLTSNLNAPHAPVPIWLTLALLGVLIFFAARQHERSGVTGPSAPASPCVSPTELTRSEADARSPSLITSDSLAGRIDDRREPAVRHREETEAREDARVDEILARLHEIGWENLGREDRELLERVSARYRSRLQRQ